MTELFMGIVDWGAAICVMSVRSLMESYLEFFQKLKSHVE